ncbi:MAG: hypothetical protein WA876_06880 [Candidatus Acidiferrales bacterium]
MKLPEWRIAACCPLSQMFALAALRRKKRREKRARQALRKKHHEAEVHVSLIVAMEKGGRDGLRQVVGESGEED